MQTIPLTQISVAANTDSVKVSFQPVAGAKDYRIRRLDGGGGSSPNDYKCAGMWHLDADTATWPWSNKQFVVDSSGNPVYPLATEPNPNGQPAGSDSGWSALHHIDIPALEIEFNGLTPGEPATLILEALDSLGPVDYQALYQDTGAGINQRINATDADCDPAVGKCALGSNMGCEQAADEAGESVCVTNGQGPAANNPNVIAQSPPFTVSATGAPALPSSPQASQVFFDTFAEPPAGAAFKVVSAGNDAGTGIETATFTTPAGEWSVSTKAIDTVASTPAFVNDVHLMGIIFDSLHVGYGSVGYSPEATADIAGGAVLHVTFEVDAHTDGRRWVACAIAPASDPLTGFELPANPGDANVNSTGEWVFFQFQKGQLLVNQGAGVPAGGGFTDNAIVGAAGQATYVDGQRPFQNYQFGHGLDNRSRFDIFITQAGFAVYEDAVLISTHNFPTPLSFSQAKVYFNAYMYHSALEQQEIVQQGRSYEEFWLPPLMSSSDERHWDNLGFEVLPAAGLTSYASLIKMPLFMPAAAAVDVAALQAQLATAQAQLAADQATVTSVQGQLTSAQATVATLESQLVSAQKAVAAAQAAVASLQSQIGPG